MHSKLPKSTDSLENVGPEANREKKTSKLKHIDVKAIMEAILVSSWVLGRPLGAMLGVWGRLEANLTQHKAILSHLGVNLRTPEANLNSI